MDLRTILSSSLSYTFIDLRIQQYHMSHYYLRERAIVAPLPPQSKNDNSFRFDIIISLRVRERRMKVGKGRRRKKMIKIKIRANLYCCCRLV